MNISINNGFLTKAASRVFDSLNPSVAALLLAVNEHRFAQAVGSVNDIRSAIDSARATENSTDEDYLTDMYVLARYVDFLVAYSSLWEKISQQQFSASWTALQDALDLLRVIKRFSAADVAFFEGQLVELEKLYPYNIFFSIGMTVKRFECSLCGADIDSVDCPHMRGHLYGGVMACAIARNVMAIDHIAIVTNPKDKRCVAAYEDSAEQFRLLRYLSTLLSSRQCRPLDFSHLRFSKRRVLNPTYVRLGRNDRCFCGSGKKFKRCCELKQYIETDHVDIISDRNAFKLPVKIDRGSHQ